MCQGLPFLRISGIGAHTYMHNYICIIMPSHCLMGNYWTAIYYCATMHSVFRLGMPFNYRRIVGKKYAIFAMRSG